MIRSLILCLLAAAPLRAEIAVPSGQTILPLDVIWEEQGGDVVLVTRYLASEIARGRGRLDFSGAEPDMDHLCATVSVLLNAATGAEASRAIVALLDRPVPRGQPDPASTQFLNVYRLEGDRCIWEGF